MPDTRTVPAPPDDARRVPLVDGREILVRPVRSSDREQLAAGFERLSPTSRYRRFFSGISELSDSTLRYLTEIDHHDHEALVALDAETGDGVGVARFIRDPQHAESAEMAIAVADDWHGRGVGTALLGLLVDRALQEDVRAFTAAVLAENEPMLEVLREIGEPQLVHREGGVLELRVELPPAGFGAHLGELLAEAARLGHERHRQ